jgi:hypothetical protein
MIFELRYKGARVETIHFEAKNDKEAERQARAFLAPRDATFVYVRPWLTDLSSTAAEEEPTEPLSASEQREQTANRERTRTRTTESGA